MFTNLPAPQTTSPITLAQVSAFAAISGDANPIHLSEDAARGAGLPGPVLHGMIVAGRFEIYLEQISDFAIAGLRVRFVRPAPVGSSITVSARRIGSSGKQLHLRLLASIEGDVLVAIGEARLEPISQAAD